MNSEITMNLKNKLKSRITNLIYLDVRLRKNYHSYLKQFYHFLEGQPFLSCILVELERGYPEAEKLAKAIIPGSIAEIPEIETEHAAVCYQLLKICCNSDVPIHSLMKSISSSGKEAFARIDYFNQLFLLPLYRYIVEEIDDEIVILSLLKSYKHKCEWFNRDRLFDLWESDKQRGEKNLALNLYEFLFDRGLDFSIEPNAIIGKPDLVSAQNSTEPFIADAKIFDKGKSYILKGFNQVYLYTLQYTQAFGYLIIFKVCQNDLKLGLSGQTYSFPYINHNNKTIFLVVIDISEIITTASKRGKIKSYVIEEKEFMEEIS